VRLPGGTRRARSGLTARSLGPPPVPVDMAGRARGPDLIDRMGMGLGVAFLGWISVSALSNGGGPFPLVLLVMGCGVSLVVARKVAASWPVAIPALIGGLGTFVVLLGPLDAFGGAGRGIFGYANARAAFFVLATVAALMVALLERRARLISFAAAVLFASVPVATGARAGTVVVGGVFAAAVLAFTGRPAPAISALAAASVIVALLATTAIAFSREPGSVDRALGSRRVRLWREAADIMAAHPIVGVGPGRFASVSSIAGSDPDARWAHHEFLHVGAETGIPGYAILLLGFLWGIGRIAGGLAPDGMKILGASGLAALGILASSDYVLHFPLVPLVAAAMVGAAAPTSAGGDRGGWSPATLARKAVKLAALPWGAMSHRRPEDLLLLLYHRVGAGGREIDVPTPRFEEHLAELADRGEVRRLDEVLRGRSGGVVMTFDDGYGDFHSNALPALIRHRIPAVLYLATGLVDQGPEALTWTQLEEAVGTGLVTVGAHTHHHADLSRADEAQAEEEMRRSQELIEDRLGVACRHFAYPWAVGSPGADRAARRLFDSAALHAWRLNRHGRVDPYGLGRTPVLRSDGPFFFGSKVRGMLEAEGVAYRILRRGPWRPS
jgi:peptidoglycan/xylan/chitin deacetylase (PgdA/CDA1 family)